MRPREHEGHEGNNDEQELAAGNASEQVAAMDAHPLADSAKAAAPRRNPASADSEADNENPRAPARANPTKTTLPVIFATKTRPRLKMLTASTTPVSTVSTSMSAGSGP